MKRPINKNTLTLQQPSVVATPADRQVVTDLLDTLVAHQAEAVGLAANMISQNKRIIALFIGPLPVAMINPTITAKSSPYQATEGCLSLTEQRQTTRYQQITVTYQTTAFASQHQTFTDFIAQIIQHELDHCNGILI
ncbi:peptide deformylase [uncultured Secundilactobacillus sp.]|uniref:peptide deformylase n=1 Tax=uncultured Secundilactobacillus sp. TaxID=2813935 RepID=UPI00258A9341|nr:peptide deformylase [uncultured Secundilactobacillus sp.]